MKTLLIIISGIGLIFVLVAAYKGIEQNKTSAAGQGKNMEKYEVQKTDSEWKKELTPLQYRVTREKGTERAFTGEYNDFKGHGVFKCVCCGNELFSSDTKFNSGSGWPSYWEPISQENVELHQDSSLWMVRTEVLCSKCGAHLGHVFDDGPMPTGQRYCINSAALKFTPEPEDDSAE